MHTIGSALSQVNIREDGGDRNKSHIVSVTLLLSNR